MTTNQRNVAVIALLALNAVFLCLQMFRDTRRIEEHKAATLAAYSHEAILPHATESLGAERHWDTSNLQIRANAAIPNAQGLKRKFVSYTSSKLEQLWLDNAKQWEKDAEICHALTTLHPALIHQLLNATCTSHFVAPYNHWCLIDDGLYKLWYNRKNDGTFEEMVMTWERPAEVPNSVLLLPAQPVVPGPDMEDVVSNFVFLDETTGEEYVEYIEPLASHLRFPLCRCINNIGPPEDEHPQNEEGYSYHSVVFKGWLIPPPPPVRYDRSWYFDAGASSWDKGAGGPSLIYFYSMWERHGIDFDRILAFEMSVPESEFFYSMPPYVRYRTTYQQTAVVSNAKDHSVKNPFLPTLIKEKVTPNDYVLFKLDIDSPTIEVGSILHILDDPDNQIDEIFWEHHISGNYLLTREWGKRNPKTTIRESMDLFLRMRQQGIRAHSWI